MTESPVTIAEDNYRLLNDVRAMIPRLREEIGFYRAVPNPPPSLVAKLEWSEKALSILERVDRECWKGWTN